MRSAFVLIDSDESESIFKILDSFSSNYENIQWVYIDDKNDPILYIQFDLQKYLLNEIESPENNLLVEIIKSYQVIQIDISGRHSGDKEVLFVVKELLSKFNGFAMDDYSDHLWHLIEIQNGAKYNGFNFFDYNGWNLKNH
ncbi:hypothetical protein PAECIP111891_06055 [Paenibacillus allorhizoplanae]|uniref:Uncharacterized protein n=1 Tax=Paenibacillus allorhizoplanae TaxID=2905648 RepID=A0ABM9CWY9_9BACL|nr:hypothetical protein [Paenibacillus allorhizoplanae]CAH1227015.1 hypothetical protein PAECIP111891_06055 [Paenibacillus allorhizoplanae]